jgi:hypothetical protein
MIGRSTGANVVKRLRSHTRFGAHEVLRVRDCQRSLRASDDAELAKPYPAIRSRKRTRDAGRRDDGLTTIEREMVPLPV